MRVCVVTVAGHGVGGMQDHTRMLAQGLVEAGHDVDVVTTRHPEGLTEERRHGATWHFVAAEPSHPRLPRRDPAWRPRSLEMFRRLEHERPFDVVHSESTSAVELVRRGIHRRVPLVAKFHGSGVAHARAHLRQLVSGGPGVRVREAKSLAWLLGVWFQHGQLYRFRPCVWMVASRRELDDTRRSHFLKRSLGHVVPNGIDTRVFRPRRQDQARAALGLDGLPLFVCAGRLDIGKGTHHALRALHVLGRRGRTARLAVVGSGPERQRLERLAADLGLADYVSFAGVQSHEGLASYLAAADAFLFPTELNEAAPLVPLQALACGRAVIASSVGSVPELIDRPGETGLLVPPGKPEALAEAMARILGDGSLRERLERNAVERVRGEYSLEKMVARTVDVYEIACRELSLARAS